MSDSTLYTLLAILFAVVVAMIAYIVIGKRKQANGEQEYQWQPEQDYDVEMRGETPMTPGFPTLVKRDKDKKSSRG